MSHSEQEIIDDLNTQISDLSCEVCHLTNVIDDLMTELHEVKADTRTIDTKMGDGWLASLAKALKEIKGQSHD